MFKVNLNNKKLLNENQLNCLINYCEIMRTKLNLFRVIIIIFCEFIYDFKLY